MVEKVSFLGESRFGGWWADSFSLSSSLGLSLLPVPVPVDRPSSSHGDFFSLLRAGRKVSTLVEKSFLVGCAGPPTQLPLSSLLLLPPSL